jgi:hypothetical protein
MDQPEDFVEVIKKLDDSPMILSYEANSGVEKIEIFATRSEFP